MKNSFIAFICAIILNSCATPYQAVYYTDYTRYLNDNFFVSALSDFSGYKYTALGDITVVYNGGDYIDNLTTQEMLDRMVQQAKGNGANGLLSVTIKKGVNYNIWVANGIAVRFATLPQESFLATIPKDKMTPPFNLEKWKSETISYLLENNLPFVKTNNLGERDLFDIETFQYIGRIDFIRKYKDVDIKEFNQEYQQQRKASRNNH